MFSLYKSNNNINHEPPTSFGGSSFKGMEKLPFMVFQLPFVRYFLLLFLVLFHSFVNAALLIKQPPAFLTYQGAIVPSIADVEVIRYERIGFYRYDETATEHFQVWPGNFASAQTLGGVPGLLGELPAPLDEQGNFLDLSAPLPLQRVVDFTFRLDEPIFIVAKSPIVLAPDSISARPDGRRYIAVTIESDAATSHIITLVETGVNTAVFVGYLQANAAHSPIVIPEGATVNLLYQGSGDVDDSLTTGAPWFVSPDELNGVQGERRGYFAVPLPPPVVANLPELFVSKQVQRGSAMVGDFLAYDIKIENNGTGVASNLRLIDDLPKGFRYQNKSTRVDGLVFAEPNISNTAKRLSWSLPNLAAGESVNLRYVVEISVGADTGQAINSARAKSNAVNSNIATASVLVEQPFFKDHAFLAGRVIVGSCGEADAPGLEGVRIYMEDGTQVLTDMHGRWHIEGVKPGTHVLQLDTLTLGRKYSLQRCEENSRKAGNMASRFVDVEGGTLWRENWYVRKSWHTESNIEQQLRSTELLETDRVHVNLLVRMGEHEFKEVLTQLHVTDNLELIPGTTTLDGMPADDLNKVDDMYEIALAPEGLFAKYELEFDLRLKQGVGSNEQIKITSETTGVTQKDNIFSVSSKNVLAVKAGNGQKVISVLEGYSGINGDDDNKIGSLAYMMENGEQYKQAKLGFTNLKEGMSFAQSVFSATALVDPKLKIKLLIDGEEVPDGHIGMRMFDPETGLNRLTWIGLEIKQVGDHDIELQGVDGFGIVRFREMVAIHRTSEIKTIRLMSAENNVANGTSPIRARLELLDEFEQPIKTRVELKIESGNLVPLNTSQLENPLENRQDIVQVAGDGLVSFEPVGSAGTYRVRLSANNGVYEDISISVAPDLRDWIMVGYAQGTLGYNTLEGNLEDLSEEEAHGYSDGETSFFARGKVKGEWLLTMAYDSRREKEEATLLQRIDPQRWYVLYGDDTIRGHDAPSSEKLYLRIEKADFYALFGDYDTGLNVTELTRYQRVLTGAKVDWKGKNAKATLFASQTNQSFIREDIAADGTSGLYRLSNKNILMASEEITIEVRDRFTNEVLYSDVKTRYLDYSIDYIDGTIYFREPILVQDENFNPRRIVVRYELLNASEELVGGGRVAVFDASEKLEVGLSAVDDNTLGAEGDLSGVDLTWKPDDKNTIKAEFASSAQADVTATEVRSQAGLLEHVYKSEKFDTRIRVEEQESNFGLGQQAGDDDDIRTSEVGGRYRINEEVALAADVSRQELLSNENQRDVAETRVEYKKENWNTYGGLRYAEDVVNTDTYRSQQAIVGASSQVSEKLRLSAKGETSVSDNDNLDYPNLLGVGADYRINHRVSVFADQEFSWGEERSSQDTRVGARSNPWQGANVSTDVSRRSDEYGPRLLAHAGLFQNIPINANWTSDFAFDRSQTIDSNQANPAFNPLQPLAHGTTNDDYTAVSAGAGYRNAQWQWTNRVEYRTADTDDKWTYMSGFRQRVDDTDSIAGSILHFDQEMTVGTKNQSTEIDLSYSRRPLNNDWFRLNRLRLIQDKVIDGFGTTEGSRAINNTHFNFIPGIGHQLSLQYSLRYVKDTIDQTLYTGYSDLIGTEYRYDITSKWDVGFRASTLASWNSEVRQNAFGVMAGYSPIKDVWISLGYNFEGFYDSDFDGAGTRMQGFVLDFRIKFDQDSARSLRDRAEVWFDQGEQEAMENEPSAEAQAGNADIEGGLE